eukprot:2587079-Alexandrium_andersonii.AAC.1
MLVREVGKLVGVEVVDLPREDQEAAVHAPVALLAVQFAAERRASTRLPLLFFGEDLKLDDLLAHLAAPGD